MLLRKYILYSVLLSLGLSKLTTGHSQVYNFKKLTEDQGLVDNQTLITFQDKNNYLWIGTKGGLSRFDGTTFTNFTIENGLPNNTIRSIQQDEKGAIWVGTDEGACLIKGLTIIPIKDSLLQTSSIRTIYIDSEKKIWFGTYENGLISFDGKSFTQHTLRKGMQEEKISCITEDSKGDLWIGTLTSGVIHYKKDDYSYLTTRHGLSNNTIRSICVSSTGSIWVGTDRGLNELKDNHIKRYTTYNGLPGNLIYHIIEDSEKNIWIATFGGMSKYDGKKFKNFTTQEGLESNGIYYLSQDTEKNIWIATDQVGLQVLNADRITYYNERGGLSNNNVFSLLETRTGEIWLGTMGGGITIYADGKYESLEVSDEIKEGYILAMLEDKKGNYWISSIGNGVIELNAKKTKKYTFNQEFHENNVFSMVEDHQGNIWFGTKGLAKWDGKKLTLFNSSNTFIDQAVFCLHEDTNGFLWIGTNGRGLFRFDGKEFIQIQPQDGLRNGTIFSIEEDNEKTIWLSTDGGVYKLKKTPMAKKYQAIRTFKDGLPDENIVALKFDKKGYLWTSSPKGVSKIDTKSYKKNGTTKITTYGKDEGFPTAECNQNALLNDSKGYLWVGTNEGAIRYNTQQDTEISQLPSPTHITSIKLFLENVNWNEYSDSITTDFNLPTHLSLAWNKNYLTFDFKSINFTNPNKVIYKFRLLGFEKNWSPPTRKTEATYSNLPPGNYIFEVVALNHSNEWNKESTTFHFTIRKPFWQMGWFYGVTILTILFIIYSIIAIRTRTLRENKKQLETEVKKRTIELKEKNNQLEHLYKEIENKNNEITDSIKYAKKIQDSLLPLSIYFKACFSESFIFFKPKDIVSGDFYWINETTEKISIAAVDCTGHGVPGAFISLVGINILNQLISEYPSATPAELLSKLNQNVFEQLNNQTHYVDIKDGMDISLCIIDKKKQQAELASAQNTIYHFNKGNLTAYPGDRWSIGSELNVKPFTNHIISLEKEDTIYLFTDGYQDQFGGSENKKFMRDNFKKLLISIQLLPMEEQEKKLRDEFNAWKGDHEQIDDVLVIGIKI